ncbi:unnamed protein product [Pleuronectes platessa]|uniref:Uncharacterized protein n=1 Tax=Pleuronectes platessa TaxID=8262 RepID=A0A9N7Y2G8_PLEPL|nr:unnamed protein product [Pleuronectes platessa]
MNQKVPALCRFNQQVVSEDPRRPCGIWLMRELQRRRHTRPQPPTSPSPTPPPEDARRYWIKSRRTASSQFGAALVSFKSQNNRKLRVPSSRISQNQKSPV